MCLLASFAQGRTLLLNSNDTESAALYTFYRQHTGTLMRSCHRQMFWCRVTWNIVCSDAVPFFQVTWQLEVDVHFSNFGCSGRCFNLSPPPPPPHIQRMYFYSKTVSDGRMIVHRCSVFNFSSKQFQFCNVRLQFYRKKLDLKSVLLSSDFS